MRLFRDLCLLFLLMLALACAGPQLRVPRASQASVEAERQRQVELLSDQRDFKFKQRVERLRRVYSVYARIRTKGAELCGSEVIPFWGLWLVDASYFPAAEQTRAKRVLNLDYEISVLATATNAAEAGIRAGDVISKINGVDIQPRFIYGRHSQLGNVLKKLEQAGLKPVEIEISRSGQNFSTIIAPEHGCRYPVRIDSDSEPNAYTDGNTMAISNGMLDLANNDEELAQVLSHELAHNVLGHVQRRNANRATGEILGTLIDIGLLLGARVDTGGTFGKSGAKAGHVAYSQEFEREADYTSLYFLARAGFDATKAPDIYRKIGVVNPGTINYGTTHPTTPERAANLEVALQEVAGKIVRGEPLVPVKLESHDASPVETTTTQAKEVLREKVLLEQRQRSSQTVSALKPVLPDQTPEPIRRRATLTHTKGKMMLTPPIVAEAEYLDHGNGNGPSRIIFPGNQIVEGKFQILPIDQSFREAVSAQLIDPDPNVTSTGQRQKGFASYSSPDGTVLECSFLLSNSARVERGFCMDNRGNEYRMTP